MPLTTRHGLTDTSRRLFHEQGHAATGVVQTLRPAGPNRGSLYPFFSGNAARGRARGAQPDPLERRFDLLAWNRQGMVRDGCRKGCSVGTLAPDFALPRKT